MSEIKLTVKDQYLNAFLTFLKTLDYVSIKKVVGQKHNGLIAPPSGEGISSPISKVDKYIEPIDEKTDLAAILKKQNYQGPDRARFQTLVETISINEPIEELLAQLTR